MNEDDTFKKMKQIPITNDICHEGSDLEKIEETAKKYGYEPDDFRRACIEHLKKMLS